MVVASIAGTNPSGEQVIDAVVVQQTGVEDRSIPWHRTVLDDGAVAEPPNESVSTCAKPVDFAEFFESLLLNGGHTRAVPRVRRTCPCIEVRPEKIF
jgi:hypothetical protein